MGLNARPIVGGIIGITGLLLLIIICAVGVDVFIAALISRGYLEDGGSTHGWITLHSHIAKTSEFVVFAAFATLHAAYLVRRMMEGRSEAPREGGTFHSYFSSFVEVGRLLFRFYYRAIIFIGWRLPVTLAAFMVISWFMFLHTVLRLLQRLAHWVYMIASPGGRLEWFFGCLDDYLGPLADASVEFCEFLDGKFRRVGSTVFVTD